MSRRSCCLTPIPPTSPGSSSSATNNSLTRTGLGVLKIAAAPCGKGSPCRKASCCADGAVAVCRSATCRTASRLSTNATEHTSHSTPRNAELPYPTRGRRHLHPLHRRQLGHPRPQGLANLRPVRLDLPAVPPPSCRPSRGCRHSASLGPARPRGSSARPRVPLGHHPQPGLPVQVLPSDLRPACPRAAQAALLALCPSSTPGSSPALAVRACVWLGQAPMPSADSYLPVRGDAPSLSPVGQQPGLPGSVLVPSTHRRPLDKTPPQGVEDCVTPCPLVPGVSRLLTGACASPRVCVSRFLQTSPRDNALALPCSFRPRLATMPLHSPARSASPAWREDWYLRAPRHARHTRTRLQRRGPHHP
jgi:hypothetical protein